MMWRRAFVFAGLLAAVLSSGASGPEQAPALRRDLGANLPLLQRAARAPSVHVVDIASGAAVFDHHGDQGRILASNTKLFTSAAALDALGPGFRFETRLLASGVVDGEVLRGNLAVLGAGDPNLSGRHYSGDSLAPFRPWAQALYRRGIRRVEGSVFLVHGFFGGPLVHPDWPRDQLTQWYEAPVAALSFNDACVLVRVVPGARPGLPVRVETVPDLEVFQLRSSALTVTSGGRQQISIARDPGSLEVRVTGQMGAGAEPVERWVTVEDPVAYLGAALQAAFREVGVAIPLPAATESLPAGPWRLVSSHTSDLLTTLEVVNKRSQNLYAESVLKTLGAQTCGRGTWEGGIQAVEEFLDRLGFERGAYRLADGSGMSRGNRFSASQVTHLLRQMYHHRWGAEFLKSLPYSGEPELRWRKRLAQPPYRGNVLAKTGTLRGVSALSGYVKGRSGRLYAFSILLNDLRDRSAAEKAQDAFLRALVDHG